MNTTHNLAASTARTIARTSDAWPAFAPTWADRARIERASHGASAQAAFLSYVFERRWIVSSRFRDGHPLAVLIVRQRFASTRASAEPSPDGEPYIEVGAEGLWADYRAQDVAALLRSMADALAPQDAPRRPAAAKAKRAR